MEAFLSEEIELCSAHAVCRADYRTILRADVRILVPRGMEKIRQFYQEIARASARWAEETEGKRLLELYESLPDIWARSRFGTGIFTVTGGPVSSDGTILVMVCQSVYRSPDGSVCETRRSAHVWNLTEESVLPMRQAVRVIPGKTARPGRGFRPDGYYPENEEAVFFRNPAGGRPFEERRVPLEKPQKSFAIRKKTPKKG